MHTARKPDPDGTRRRALKLAADAARRVVDAETKQRAAFRYATEAGASLRDIAGATGVPHMTVKRILERS